MSPAWKIFILSHVSSLAKWRATFSLNPFRGFLETETVERDYNSTKKEEEK